MARYGPTESAFNDVGGCSPRTGRGVDTQNPPPAARSTSSTKRTANNGMATLVTTSMRGAGMRFLHTAIPAAGRGSSNRSLSRCHQPAERGHNPVMDQTGLDKVSSTPGIVATRDGYRSVPGRRMPSASLKHSGAGREDLQPSLPIGKVGQSSRCQRFSERGRAREGRLRYSDHGAPVGPVSWCAGVHERNHRAAVLGGEREVIQYALGPWGKESPSLMDPKVVTDRDRPGRGAENRNHRGVVGEGRARFGAGVSDGKMILGCTRPATRTRSSSVAIRWRATRRVDVVDLVSGLEAATELPPLSSSVRVRARGVSVGYTRYPTSLGTSDAEAITLTRKGTWPAELMGRRRWGAPILAGQLAQAETG